MNLAPVDILTAAQPFIPEALVSRRAWSQILPLAALQPSVPCIQFLEIRLARDDERVDYQIIGRLPHSAALVEQASRVSRERGCQGRGGTDAFATELRHRRDLRSLVPFMGLEYDLPLDQPASWPQVGFCVNPGYGGAAGKAPPPSSPALRRPVLRALRALRTQPLSGGARATLKRCLDELPARATLMHVAALVGRAGEVRLVPQIPIADVPAYLRRVGWLGDRSRTRQVMALCRNQGRYLKIDVDLGSGVLPKFAAFAEFSATKAMTRRKTYAMTRPLIRRLTRLGLCDQAKGDALVGWPSRVAVVAGRRGPFAVLLLHLDFKVVAWDDGRLEAKAYLGVLPYFPA